MNLRAVLARLTGATPDDIILGNSASYGLGLLAAGIRWKAEDEILFLAGEFPATVFPWHFADSHGVRFRYCQPSAGTEFSVDDIAARIGIHTRVVCVSWVNSFSGYTVDIDTLGRACKRAGVILVVNASQALGARAVDISAGNFDAFVCCGYKWLLGPYGTGFCWIRPELRDELQAPPPYWLASVWGRGTLTNYERLPKLGARAFDVMGTPNFLNFATWTSALQYLVACDLHNVERYDDALVEMLLCGVPRDRFHVVSPLAGPMRSSIVVIRPRFGSAGDLHGFLSDAGIDVALREGTVRFAPHLYNTVSDVERVVQALSRYSPPR